MISRTNFLKVSLNTTIGVLLVLLWLHFVDFSVVLESLLKVNPLFILTFVALFLLAGFFRAARLKLLLRKYPLLLKELTPLTYLSQFLSFMIPIRAGEVAKGVYLTTKTGQFSGTSFAKSLVWVFLDRFLDFLIIVLVVAVLITSIPNNLPSSLQKFIEILLSFFSLSAVLMIFSNTFSKRLLIFISKFLVFDSLKERFLRFSLSIAEEFPILYQGPLHFLELLLLTAFAVGADTLNFYLLLTAVGVKIEFLRALLGSGLNILSYLIPSAPGYVGSAEAAGLAVYSGGLGIPSDLASSAIVLFHLLNIVFIPLFGVISLYLLEFDLSLVWSKLKRS